MIKKGRIKCLNAKKDKKILFCMIFLFPSFLIAQVLKSTLAMQGGAVSNDEYYVSHTVGQVITGGTSSFAKTKVIQGFEFMFSNIQKKETSNIINNQNLQLFISPNPFTSSINVEGKGIQFPVEVYIFDILGRLIMKKNIKNIEENNINVGYLNQAKYLIQLKTNNQKFSTVLIKRNP